MCCLLNRIDCLAVLLCAVTSTSPTRIRQLTFLNYYETGWPTAERMCRKFYEANLVTLDTPNILTAMKIFKETVWKGEFAYFWTGLHRYMRRSQDYSWADCRPLNPSDWAPWADPGGTQIRQLCVRGRPDLTIDSNWEARDCYQFNGHPLCEKDVGEGNCPFHPVLEVNVNRNVDVNVTIDVNVTNVTTLAECFAECRIRSAPSECWAVTFQDDVCRLYSSYLMDTVYNSLENDADVTVYMKLCFTASLSEKWDWTLYTITTWPRCDGPATTPVLTTSAALSPPETSAVTKTPRQTPEIATTATPLTITATVSTTATTSIQTPTTASQHDSMATPLYAASGYKVQGTTLVSVVDATDANITNQTRPTPVPDYTAIVTEERTTVDGTSDGDTTSPYGTQPAAIDDICKCRCGVHPVTTDEEKETFIENIITNLTIDTGNLSAARRKRECADDHRTSAQTAGGVAIAILTLVFGGLFILDIRAFLRLGD